MREAWARFLAHEEWRQVKCITSPQHGDLVGETRDRVLSQAPYEPAAFVKK